MVGGGAAREGCSHCGKGDTQGPTAGTNGEGPSLANPGHVHGKECESDVPASPSAAGCSAVCRLKGAPDTPSQVPPAAAPAPPPAPRAIQPVVPSLPKVSRSNLARPSGAQPPGHRALTPPDHPPEPVPSF